MDLGSAFIHERWKAPGKYARKKRGSFGDPVGEGNYNNSLYATSLDSLGGSQGHIGLEARADLRSCSEWYTDDPERRLLDNSPNAKPHANSPAEEYIKTSIRKYIRENISPPKKVIGQRA